MELLKKLRPEMWMETSCENIKGLVPYTVVRNDRGSTPGTFRYAVKEVKDDGGHIAIVTLEGVKPNASDPLEKVRNVELLLENDYVTAINLDGDCVCATATQHIFNLDS